MQIPKQEEIDFNKFISYSKPGPRYTRYPTAIEFHSLDEQTYIQNLQNQKSNTPLSLYFHLPFCKSACYFCGCSVIHTNNNEKKDKYIQYIKKEIDILSKYLDTSRVVSQMHFGGGTPTFFSSENLQELISHIKKTFTNFDKNPEISCEVDPRYFNEEQMKVLADGGFNRISFGVQDFDIKVQEGVNRIQSYQLVENVVKLARNYNIQSVNIDLIYGLPFQNVKSFEQTIEKTISLNPDRLAIFNYAHVPWIKSIMNKIDEQTLPTPDVKMQILKMIIDKLSHNGYNMIGMDHFAKPEDELFSAIEKNQLYRNFQGYTTKGGCDLIGIGVTSIGYTSDYYAQNAKDLKAYEEAIDNNKLPIAKGFSLNIDDKIRQKVIINLMSNFYLDMKDIENTFDINFKQYFKKEISNLQPFVDDGFIQISDNNIKLLNQTAIMIIRNIVMVFDAYMDKNKTKQKTFSKTI
jgi:oxygen-independent coproporphyrinogen-3 oxidase